MTSGKTPPRDHEVGYGTPPVHTRFRKGYACPQTQVSRRVNADTDVVEAERMHQFSASEPCGRNSLFGPEDSLLSGIRRNALDLHSELGPTDAKRGPRRPIFFKIP
jgi:hypothetical protein